MTHIKKRALSFFLLILFSLLMLGLFFDLYPLFKQVIKDSGNEQQLVSYIHAYGSKGVLSLVGLQALQVIMMFFPAAAIQVLAGLCYGVLWGALISLAGYILGNVLVFIGVRQFKQTFPLFFDDPIKKSKKISFFDLKSIKTMKQPQVLVFFLYLIPGIPNGILPYLFAETKIKLRTYLVSMSLASIPSTLLMTWLGESVVKQNPHLIVLISLLVVLLLGISLCFRKQIKLKIQRLTHNSQQ